MRVVHAGRVIVGVAGKVALGVVFVAMLAVGARVAHAQPSAQDKAAAEAAFRQGRDLMAQGEYASACMAFRSSQQLDPQLGTQYNLGLCYEKGGMLASAWGELTDLAARDTNAARKKDAAARAKKLEPRLVKLLVVVRQMQPGLRVTRDGNDITPLVGVATPVDPGTSVLEAEAPGFERFSIETSLVGEGTTVTVEIPPLTALPEPPPDQPPPDRVVLPPPPPPKKKIDLDPGKGRRLLGITVAAVGVAALAGGVTVGMMARSANEEARDLCGGDVTDCRGDAVRAAELVDSARTRGTVSTIAIGAGAAAVVGGVLLYVTAPAKRRPSEMSTLVPTAGRSHVGVALTGRF